MKKTYELYRLTWQYPNSQKYVYLGQAIRIRLKGMPYIYFHTLADKALLFSTKKAAKRNLELLKKLGHTTAKIETITRKKRG